MRSGASRTKLSCKATRHVDDRQWNQGHRMAKVMHTKGREGNLVSNKTISGKYSILLAWKPECCILERCFQQDRIKSVGVFPWKMSWCSLGLVANLILVTLMSYVEHVLFAFNYWVFCFASFLFFWKCVFLLHCVLFSLLETSTCHGSIDGN